MNDRISLRRTVFTVLCLGLLGGPPRSPAADCPEDMPYALSVDTPGSIPGGDDRGGEDRAGGDRVREVPLVPGQTASIEVTVYLENLTGAEHEVFFSYLFAACVAHDGDLLDLEEITLEGTDYRPFASWDGSLGRLSSETGSGFYVVNPETFGEPERYLLGERMSLARARYALRAPFGPERAGETVPTKIRFEDGLRPGPSSPPCESTVNVGGWLLTPCFRNLEVRFHVEADRAFARGDANLDSKLDVSDAVAVLRSVLGRADAPIRCADAADANDDGRVDLADPIAIFGHLFMGGPPPEAPFPEPGVDATADELACGAWG